MSQTLARKISYVWRDYIAEVSGLLPRKSSCAYFVFFFHFDFPVLWSGGVEKNMQTWSTGPQSQPTQYHVHKTMLYEDDIIK